jgi:prepilin-type processing-associated H-X9-DG protein
MFKETRSLSSAALAILVGLSTMPAYADVAALPTGPNVGDQNLSPFYRWTDALPVRPALCAGGSDLVWKTFAGATHNGGLNASFADALAFFRDTLAGRKPQSNCADVAEPGEPMLPSKEIPFND